MPRLPELPGAHDVNPQHCEACKVHAILRGLPRHRANRPADAPSQNANSTLTGANRYARAYSEHRADRP
jgi:hypothetical protein